MHNPIFPRRILLGTLLLAAGNAVFAGGTLEKAKIYLERNVTDNDVEAVVEAGGDDTGLAALAVTGPDGRTLADFKSPDTKMGIRSFRFESPEPENDGSVQADFPAGTYRFIARTVDGETLEGTDELEHAFPKAAALVNPEAGQKEVPVKGLTIEWQTDEDLSACILVIEQEETDLEITAKLSGMARSFAVTEGFLQPHTEYKIAVGTVSLNGNESYVEISFETAGQD